MRMKKLNAPVIRNAVAIKNAKIVIVLEIVFVIAILVPVIKSVIVRINAAVIIIPVFAKLHLIK